MNFGTTEIILIVAVLFLLFGASRLPQLAKSLGQSRKAFKEGMREAEEEERAEAEAKRLADAKNVAGLNAPRVTEIDDEARFDEARRASQAKQQ
jgi:sec-independent protein translocase protein TatA